MSRAKWNRFHLPLSERSPSLSCVSIFILLLNKTLFFAFYNFFSRIFQKPYNLNFTTLRTIRNLWKIRSSKLFAIKLFTVKRQETLWSFICVEIIFGRYSAFRRNAIFKTSVVLQISILRIDCQLYSYFYTDSAPTGAKLFYFKQFLV